MKQDQHPDTDEAHPLIPLANAVHYCFSAEDWAAIVCIGDLLGEFIDSSLDPSIKADRRILNQIYVERSVAYRKLKMHDAGIEFCRRAVEVIPNSEFISMNYFQMLREANREEDAINEMMRYLKFGRGERFYQGIIIPDAGQG